MTDTTFMAYQLGLIDRLESNFTEAERVCVGGGGREWSTNIPRKVYPKYPKLEHYRKIQMP